MCRLFYLLVRSSFPLPISLGRLFFLPWSFSRLMSGEARSPNEDGAVKLPATEQHHFVTNTTKNRRNKLQQHCIKGLLYSPKNQTCKLQAPRIFFPPTAQFLTGQAHARDNIIIPYGCRSHIHNPASSTWGYGAGGRLQLGPDLLNLQHSIARDSRAQPCQLKHDTGEHGRFLMQLESIPTKGTSRAAQICTHYGPSVGLPRCPSLLCPIPGSRFLSSRASSFVTSSPAEVTW